MGRNVVLKEFGALIWQHPLVASCFLLLFTPPFFPLLRFFFPLLISTALFVVAIFTMAPHFREAGASIENAAAEERQLLLKPDLQLELVWLDTTLQLKQLEELQHEAAAETWGQQQQQQLVTETTAPSPPPPTSAAAAAEEEAEESGKKSRWMNLRRIYEEKGINWIENLFRNENWKGAAGITDANVSILQEAFGPHRHHPDELPDDDEQQTALPLLKKKSTTPSVDDKSSTTTKTTTGAPPPPELPPEGFAAFKGHNVAVPSLVGGVYEGNGFGEGYESDDGYDEEGHSDLETGSPIQGNDVHEEVEAEEARDHQALIIHALPQEQHAILSAAEQLVPREQQPQVSLLQELPPLLHKDSDPVLGMMSSSATTIQPEEQTSCWSLLHGGSKNEDQEILAAAAPPLIAAMTPDKTVVVASTETLENGACLVSGMHEESSSATAEPENSSGLCSLESGSCDNGHLEANLAIDTGVCEDRHDPSVDVTLGQERSEVVSNRKLHKEVSLPATEVCQGERFVPFTKTHEKSSPVSASEFGEAGHEERTPVSDTDVTKTAGETKKLVEERLSGNTLSRETSLEGVSEIATPNNHKEKSIPSTEEVPEQRTGCHVPSSPKLEEPTCSIPAAEVCLDAAAAPGVQAHELPVAESLLSLCT